MMLLFTTIPLYLLFSGLAGKGLATHLQSRAPPVGADEPSSTSKAGLAWANGNFKNYRQYTTTGKVLWYYTWNPFPINANIEFVPMLWGSSQASAFSASIVRIISRTKVTAILGMNEPQQADQSNMSPEDGASLWKRHLEPLKSRGMRLGSPAPSSAPSGKVWLQEWLEACAGGCNPDFIALHWYGTNASTFQAYLEDFHDTFQLPIWVTEWACHDFNGGPQCTYEQIVDFLNETQSYMDNTEWVERYSWFGVMENPPNINPANAMMDNKGRVNALGEQYIGAVPGAASRSATALFSNLFTSCLAVLFLVISSEIL